MPLVLTRNVRQSFVIDNEIKVTVFSVRGSQVKIGIDAPNNVAIYRQEIQDKINAENNQKQEGVQKCQIN